MGTPEMETIASPRYVRTTADFTHLDVPGTEGGMSAKHKFNSANALGTLLVAGLFGGVTGSFGVFLLALLVAGYHAGDIRK
jgi:hypothetical protein